MTTQINREEFLSALEAASPGLSSKDILDQSSCFIFMKNAIWTFNGEVACRVPYKLNGLTGAVNGAKLIAPLKMMPEEELSLEQEEGNLILVGVGHRVGVTMEAEVLLPIKNMEKPTEWNQADEMYSEALMMAYECADGDKEKFATNCVHFHPEWIEAWDNKQLLRFKMETGVSRSTLVKRDSVKHVSQVGVVEVAETESWLHFKNPSGMIISCRRYIEDFIDLTPNLEVKGSNIQLPKGLIQSADIAELFSSENIDNNYATVQIKTGKLRIQSKGASGWYTATRELNYVGDPLSFRIAPKLLKHIVSKYNDCIINKNRIKVDGGKWEYVACLASLEKE